MKKRQALRLLRVKYDLTQEQMAERLGVDRGTYANIELGKRRGSIEFWETVQKEFNIPDADMYALQRMGKVEED